jgi:hypothetical protein
MRPESFSTPSQKRTLAGGRRGPRRASGHCHRRPHRATSRATQVQGSASLAVWSARGLVLTL